MRNAVKLRKLLNFPFSYLMFRRSFRSFIWNSIVSQRVYYSCIHVFDVCYQAFILVNASIAFVMTCNDSMCFTLICSFLRPLTSLSLSLSLSLARARPLSNPLIRLVSIKSQSVAKCRKFRRVSQNFGAVTLCDERKLLY